MDLLKDFCVVSSVGIVASMLIHLININDQGRWLGGTLLALGMVGVIVLLLGDEYFAKRARVPLEVWRFFTSVFALAGIVGVAVAFIPAFSNFVVGLD